MSARNPWVKFLGIVGTLLEFDSGDGPKIKYDTQLRIRNAADSADAVLSGADPAAAQDFVTRAYHDANPPSGALSCIEIPFTFSDAGSAVTSTFAAAVGGRVTMVKVEITTAFDADTDIEVGDTADADRLVVAGEVKEEKLGLSEFPQYTDTVADNFDVTLAASAATAGAGRCLIYYTVPTA
jgi:hypothetical protein